MAASSRATNFQLYGSRKQMLRIPPSYQLQSNSWTSLYLVSPPLPSNISILRFDIISHDQGWCDRPQDGSWSWFEVSILGSWQENANPVFNNLNDAEYLKSSPDDFGMVMQENGLYFKEIPTEGNKGRTDPSSAISLPFAKNNIHIEWKHQAVEWTRRVSDDKGARFLSVLEEGDRLAIWVRTKFAGWENFVNEARISLSTIAGSSSDRQYNTSPSIPTEIERRHVGGSMSHDNLDDRFSVTGAIEDPEEAIHAAQRNTAVGPQHIKKIDKVVEALRLSQQTLEATPEDHPHRAGRLQSLGMEYHDRYQRTGAETDLKLAIRHFQQALEATPQDHLHRASRLHSLGMGYGERYQRTGAETDLELAIQYIQQALEATPQDHPDQAHQFQSLGIVYYDRYQRTGAELDLEFAIQQFQQALNATPQDHPYRTRWLHSLGMGYYDRYQRTGAEIDLELAIQQCHQALEAVPQDHIYQADSLQSLGMGYRERYHRTGAETDLELAIQLFQQALEITPENHTDRARRLQSLGIGYSERYQRTGAETDHELATQQFQQALEIIPRDHPHRVRQLESLAKAYGQRYLITYAETDLKITIQYSEQALEITPKDHPARNSRLGTLGISYLNRYYRTGAKTDLESAIQLCQQALEATPPDDPERAHRLQTLGHGYHDRYQRTGAEKDLDLAIQQYQDAVHHPSSRVLDRLRSGKYILNLHARVENWSSAHRIATIVMPMIAQLTPHSLDISDKQYLLTELSGLASDAAAIALMGRETPYEALQLLELGRGVIMGSINETRVDISDLLQQHPLLGAEYIELRDQVNAPTYQLDQLGMRAVVAHRVNQRYNANQKLDKTIQTIRNLPGFDRFLMAPSEDEFKAAAASGPIAIINVSNFRCDALIVEKHGIKSIPLPHLHTADIQDREAALARPEALDTRLLEWLWDAIANPVLHALALMQKPDGCWPRIWWIPTGPLARFPIHAAGYHYYRSETVLDRAISSYSSSVRALLQSRQRSPTLVDERSSKKAVLVGMEKTPGLNNLPFVPLEMNELERVCGLLRVQICQPQPCRDDILFALNDCDIFHFAGHGETDQLDPSRSSLVLADGPLAVADLFETNLHDRKPFLAYLSACGTGQIRNDALIDEALHLIAGYQIAGFRHVIGTLWEVKDETCVDVATILYTCLEERNMTDASVSEGLHRASRKLREMWILENTARAAKRMAVLQDEDAPMATKQISSCQGKERNPRDADQDKELSLNWIPYVHFGI